MALLMPDSDRPGAAALMYHIGIATPPACVKGGRHAAATMKRLRREALLADRHRRARRLVGGLGRVVAQQMGEFFERGKKVGKQPMVARVGILLRARLDTRLDTLLSGV